MGCVVNAETDGNNLFSDVTKIDHRNKNEPNSMKR